LEPFLSPLKPLTKGVGELGFGAGGGDPHPGRLYAVGADGGSSQVLLQQEK